MATVLVIGLLWLADAVVLGVGSASLSMALRRALTSLSLRESFFLYANRGLSGKSLFKPGVP